MFAFSLVQLIHLRLSFNVADNGVGGGQSGTIGTKFRLGLSGGIGKVNRGGWPRESRLKRDAQVTVSCLTFTPQSRYCHGLPCAIGFGPLSRAGASAVPILLADHKMFGKVRMCLKRLGAISARPLPGLVIVAVLLVTAMPVLHAAQPIAYSHKQHLAMGLQCLDCHSMADIGPAATIPSVTKCMLCHAKLGTSNPEIKKVADFAVRGREIPWERVYGFSPQALVKFKHAPHIQAKVECATCHGDMTQAGTAEKLVNHTMGTCLSCHREKGASQDCATCHY